MSASLVGSEMCIRDSPRCAANRCESPQAFAAPGARLSELVRRWPRGAVSYTHLTLPTICSV
eukprot:13749864-Alexandrium_andersonii.AAC.1